MYMRSYAARHANESRALLLMAPGCVRNELGEPDAPLSIEESIPTVVNVLLTQRGNPACNTLIAKADSPRGDPRYESHSLRSMTRKFAYQ